MLDPSGANAKLRPGVIITPTEAIVGDDPFVVVAVTSTFDEPIADSQVKLPWNRDKRKVGTKLNKPAVAHCRWLFPVRLSEIQDVAGVVPPPVLKEILVKVAKYGWEESDADDLS
jgi:mRNA-degrading endonuclease toxin of MazEF toxin-antitoxin module